MKRDVIPRRRCLAVAAALAFAGSASAHEHWILAEPAYPAAGAPVSVAICSGHAFPKSEILLGAKLLAGTVLAGAQGQPVAFKPEADGSRWVAKATPAGAGVWRAEFALQKPLQDSPIHRSRCLVVAGGKDDPSAYADGKGIEIVPRGAVSGLKPGDVIPLEICIDGKPAAGKITVMPEKGGVSFLSTGRDRPAELKIAAPGWYVLGVSNQGRTFSLTFFVPAAGAAP